MKLSIHILLLAIFVLFCPGGNNVEAGDSSIDPYFAPPPEGYFVPPTPPPSMSDIVKERKYEPIDTRALLAPVSETPKKIVPGHRQDGSFWGPNNYAECIEKYIPDCKTGRAVSYVKRACTALFKNGAVMSEKSAICILDNVPNAKADRGATELYRTCISNNYF
ncbi:hypothetical protein [Maridesulfovibrio sp.]|uniref:hypothetical protein n=1 Tax=Maridesulfovibrio sp. TaxID=2795000 RepID=UPI003B00E763